MVINKMGVVLQGEKKSNATHGGGRLSVRRNQMHVELGEIFVSGK
jgi:hypothetical protein